MKTRRFSYVTLFLLLTLCILILSYRPILNGAGGFLAPTSEEGGEVLILEGTQIIKNSGMNVGMRLLSEGRAKRMVVVIHKPSKGDQAFALQNKYTQLIINELGQLGLEKEKVQVISVPIGGHPVTLAEARFVAAKLGQDGVRSAILLSEGFHARRSFGVYNQEGARVGLHVVPYPYFMEYEGDSWWHDAQGISDFLTESLKLSYYLLHGYVSIRFLLIPGTRH